MFGASLPENPLTTLRTPNPKVPEFRYHFFQDGATFALDAFEITPIAGKSRASLTGPPQI